MRRVMMTLAPVMLLPAGFRDHRRSPSTTNVLRTPAQQRVQEDSEARR